MNPAKTIGIVSHSMEGGALCFITACREGAARMGSHMHPPIVVSAIPLALSMPGWNEGRYGDVGKHLADGVRQVADAGADFYICPDNTAHIVLEQIADELPLPGLHIAHVVCREIESNGWQKVGLLGTNWTMAGPVYASALAARGMERLIPDESTREQLHSTIFEKLCQGDFGESATRPFVRAIEHLKNQGAECVILGCTEIPIVVTSENSPLPIVDSTRLLAKFAVLQAISEGTIPKKPGWLEI